MPFGQVLTEITIDDSQIYKLLGPAVSTKIKSKYVRVLNKLGQLAVQAYQSKVPVDTYQLRDTQISILKRATSRDPIVQVGIVNTIHTGSRGDSMPAPMLADILNIGLGKGGNSLHRTRTSDAIAPFSGISRGQPTKNWIRSARQAFANAKRNYLSANRF